LVDVPPTTEAVPEELKVEAPAVEAPAAEAPAAEAPAPAETARPVFWDDATAQGEAKP